VCRAHDPDDAHNASYSETENALAVRPLGFVVALPAEARSLGLRRAGFGDLVQLPEGHWLAVSGAGPEHARLAVSRLLERNVAALVSWGCAAALAPQLRPGELVVPERLLGADGIEHAVDAEWRRRFTRALSPGLPTIAGTLLESPRIVAEPIEKQAMHAATGGMAVDMESAAVARAAMARRLPFLTVRAIADPAAMALPEAVAVSLNPRGDVRLSALLRHLLGHPGQIADLTRLGRAFGSAVAALRRARSLAGADYCFVPPPDGGSLP
jgi:adenosylhomocysteine nucleosidase